MVSPSGSVAVNSKDAATDWLLLITIFAAVTSGAWLPSDPGSAFTVTVTYCWVNFPLWSVTQHLKVSVPTKSRLRRVGQRSIAVIFNGALNGLRDAIDVHLEAVGIKIIGEHVDGNALALRHEGISSLRCRHW